MIYGDNPQKINEREDKLGLKTYTMVPQLTAVAQSGNLYVYGINNPVMYRDLSGNFIISTAALLIADGALLFGTIGGLVGNHIANKNDATGWDKALYIIGWTLAGGTLGSLLGYIAAPAIISATGISGISITAAGISTIAAAGTTFGTYGILLEQNPNIAVNWSLYAKHGLQRMAERGITQQMVDSWVKYGKVLQQGTEKYMFITREGVAIVTKLGKLVTAYSKAQFTDEFQKLVEMLFGR